MKGNNLTSMNPIFGFSIEMLKRSADVDGA